MAFSIIQAQVDVVTAVSGRADSLRLVRKAKEASILEKMSVQGWKFCLGEGPLFLLLAQSSQTLELVSVQAECSLRPMPYLSNRETMCVSKAVFWQAWGSISTESLASAVEGVGEGKIEIPTRR
ncbi:hypothetical protein N7513_000981 [Penicillium frequentans]|nr:hypothetical protein N7513_000981 [Penicillium glabrum]